MSTVSLSNSTRDYSQVTVGVSCVVEKGGKYLCVQEHRPGLPDHGTWNIPTGLIDPGESPVRAAVRECLEETGFTGDVTGFLGVFSLVRNDLIDFYTQIPAVVKLVFTMSLTDDVQGVISDDVQRVAWYSREELHTVPVRDPHIFDMFDQYERGIIYDVAAIMHHSERIN